MRRFGVLIACANVGVLLTVAWWIGFSADPAPAGPVEAAFGMPQTVFVEVPYRTGGEGPDALGHASFTIRYRAHGSPEESRRVLERNADVVQAELARILARQAEELRQAFQLWMFRGGSATVESIEDMILMPRGGGTAAPAPHR